MDEYITFKDIERIFKLNRQAVYYMMKVHKLKSYKIGRRRRFKLSEVEAFFQSNSDLAK